MRYLTATDALSLLLAGLAGGLLWVLASRAATPDASAAVLGALHQAAPASVVSITVLPLRPGRAGGGLRPFQLRGAAGVRALLPGLHQLRPVAVDSATFQPLLDATLVVKLATNLAEAWHLHGHDVVLRLATAPQGAVALRAQSRVVYQSTLLNERVRQVRDSVLAR